MKCIGLLGGMSWESTLDYYRLLNQGVRQHLGGLHSARILLHSVDFAEVEQLQVKGDWGQAGELLADAAKGLQAAGADAMLICSNLMHKVAPTVESRLEIPLLHIADATGKAIRAKELKKVGLLGARYTMEEDFYRQRLKENFGIDVIIPDERDRSLVHKVIFDELCCGKFTDSARSNYLQIIDKLAQEGAQGVILGCTEIPLLIKPGQVSLPLFNTSDLHVKAALKFMLADS